MDHLGYERVPTTTSGDSEAVLPTGHGLGDRETPVLTLGKLNQELVPPMEDKKFSTKVEMALPKRELLALQIMPMMVQTQLFRKGLGNLKDEEYTTIIKEALKVADIFLKELA